MVHSMFKPVLFSILMYSFGLHVLLGQEISDKTTYMLVRTEDGNQYIGRLLQMDSATIVLETPIFPELAIPRYAIKSMKPVSLKRTRQSFSAEEIPIAGAYFVTSSAYGVPVGESYYSNGMVLFNRYGVGLSPYFSVQAGLLVIFEDFIFPGWVAPKISIPLQQNLLTVALEGVIGRGFDIFTDYEETTLNGLQALMTLGSRTNNLTVGCGLAWSGLKWARQPQFSLSGTLLLSKRMALMTQNYFFLDRSASERVHIGMIGSRLYGRVVNFDFGVNVIKQSFYTDVVPWLGLGISFR